MRSGRPGGAQSRPAERHIGAFQQTAGAPGPKPACVRNQARREVEDGEAGQPARCARGELARPAPKLRPGTLPRNDIHRVSGSRTYRLLGSTTEKLLGHGRGQGQDQDHDRRLHPAGVGFVALKAKRYRWLGPARRYLCEFGRSIHPGWLRCPSSQYVEYSSSPRLASRAPRPPKFTHLSSRGSLPPDPAPCRGIRGTARENE